MNKKLLLLVLLFALFPLKEITLASSYLNVVISEIAWMGTNNSYNDEWIELYNNTNSSVDLENWTLKAVDDKPKIILSGTIQANGFYLLERTDDSTVPNITADQIYTGALGNNGEHLRLFDNQNNLIDEVGCGDGWFAGDNKTKQTMERIDFLLISTSSNWQTSKNPLGTPKTTNSVLVEQEAEQEPVPEPESTQEPKKEKEEQIQIYPTGVIFNEILPSPDGPDAENEWIELFNENNFDVNLFDWKIKDSVGSVTTYLFPKNSIIKRKSYLIVLRPETKIILNNDADSLSLLQPNNAMIDTVSYKKAPRAQSYSLIDSSWFWSEKPTPENDNIIEQKEKEPERIIVKELVNKPESKEILGDSGKMIASVAETTIKTNNQFLKVFSTASIFAVFSSTAILVLKKIINKKKLIFKQK